MTLGSASPYLTAEVLVVDGPALGLRAVGERGGLLMARVLLSSAGGLGGEGGGGGRGRAERMCSTSAVSLRMDRKESGGGAAE